MTTTEIRTLADLPFHFSGCHPKSALVRRCSPVGIEALSSRQFFEQIRDFSLGLKEIGVSSGDRVALICETRPEWMVVDLGVLAAGAVTIPIYPTLTAERIRYILADSGATTVVDDLGQHFRAVLEFLPVKPAPEPGEGVVGGG